MREQSKQETYDAASVLESLFPAAKYQKMFINVSTLAEMMYPCNINDLTHQVGYHCFFYRRGVDEGK